MYISIYFTLQELVHPKIIAAIGHINSWMRLDAGVLKDIDYIRAAWYKKYGSGVYCNRIDKGLDSRGLRPPDDPDGSWYSTHKMGGTFDLEPVNGKHREFWIFVHDLIKFGKITNINTIESRSFTPTWTHVAKMNHDKKPYIIKP